MAYVRAAGMILMIALLTGCAGRQPEAPPAPEPGRALADARREFQRVDPNVQVGLVTAVRQDDRLAAVAELSLQQLRQNDVINFVDTNRQPLTSGTVVRLTETTAVVRYESPSAGRRHPREGDLAVFIGRR